MRRRRLVLAIMLMIVAGCPCAAFAREHHNHDSEIARGALERGEVLPLPRVLALTAQYLPGDVVEVRLDPRRSGDLLYRIRVLTRSGQIEELVLDARTGMFIRIED
jgi:uncharacterized membrane protein YkoI